MIVIFFYGNEIRIKCHQIGMDQKVSPKVSLDQSIDEKVSPKVSLDRKCHQKLCDLRNPESDQNLSLIKVAGNQKL